MHMDVDGISPKNLVRLCEQFLGIRGSIILQEEASRPALQSKVLSDLNGRLSDSKLTILALSM